MPNINLDDAYILDETGAQVDKVTGLFTKDEETTSGEKAFAQLNIGTAGSNRNLLDNPFFTVNQRSFTSSTGVNNIYSVDRWYIARGTGTISKTNNGITIDGTSASRETAFQQMIDCGDVTGRAVTVSVNDGGTIRQITGTVPARTTSNNIFIRFTLRDGVSAFLYAMSTSSAYAYMLQVQVNAGYTIDIRAVKLELGSVSTLANDAPPDYGEELAKCKYYCRVVDFDTDVSVGIGWAFSNSGAVIPNIFGFGNEMRAVPAVTSTGSFVLRTTSGANINVTSFAIGASVKDAISLNASVASGLTANQPVRLQAGTGAKLAFSADL